ncbi:inosine/xanthosine triphosphatase [Roseivirga misakiensis]|uniref:Probable inosine/xanthosine triphosphatase n=1 Tax=Roseivirga misakiensis TaxID=1563681 RepID=A0A1E5T6Y9_9BACT|nr:inosine/xanthosine triphosphatase [Roseivirga misakiensis]OEK07130.1 inositol monophosphatase [Roseivirga misakiensis]
MRNSLPSTEIKVIVGSKNPVKLKCTQDAFQQVFPDNKITVEGAAVPSDVSDQPMTDEETWIGAKNRSHHARNSYPESDYWVGIEGGITDSPQKMEAFAWVYILSRDANGDARTSAFQLPPKIQELVRQGIELGEADDIVFNRSNSKQSNGAVGILTKDLINRADYYQPAVVLALIPFINPDLY